jgi:hypothetical protein
MTHTRLFVVAGLVVAAVRTLLTGRGGVGDYFAHLLAAVGVLYFFAVVLVGVPAWALERRRRISTSSRNIAIAAAFFVISAAFLLGAIVHLASEPRSVVR